MQNIAIFGASGAIGAAFVNALASNKQVAQVFAFSRSGTRFPQANVYSHSVDIHDEHSIEYAATEAQKAGPLDKVIVATGMLHDETIMPEKSLRELSAEKFHALFATNTIAPALIAKHFLPLLAKDKPSVFAALSARVGSISDNRLGGWYAYRASKAALNMLLKTASIELARRNKQAAVIGLHPGTVDSRLSQPFQSGVAEGKLFSPEYAVEKLLHVINNATAKDTGKVFAWDGQVIPY